MDIFGSTSFKNVDTFSLFCKDSSTAYLNKIAQAHRLMVLSLDKIVKFQCF